MLLYSWCNMKRKQNIPKRIKIAVDDVKFQIKFHQNTRSKSDRRGFGYDNTKKKHFNKKEIVKRVKEISDEEKVRLVSIISKHPDVQGVHDLRTRQSGKLKFVQFHIFLIPNHLQRNDVDALGFKIFLVEG